MSTRDRWKGIRKPLLMAAAEVPVSTVLPPPAHWHALRVAEVGESHLAVSPPVPCQDACTALAGGRPLLLVADGLGSRPLSHVGSDAVVRLVPCFLAGIEDLTAGLLDREQEELGEAAAAEQACQRYARRIVTFGPRRLGKDHPGRPQSRAPRERGKMTWPVSGYFGRQFPEGRIRPGGCSGAVLFFPLAALLLVWLLLPQRAVAEEDEYTLPDNHPCYVTLEGYKRFFGQRIDNYFLLTLYRLYAEKMERWQRCCPGGEKTATKFRPKNADEPLPQSVLDIEVPDVFAKDAPCNYDIYFGRGKNWREEHIRSRRHFWESQYENITKNLHTCCVKHLNECLEGAFKQDTSAAGRQRMSAESTSCLERFSPEYEAKAEKSPNASPPQPTKKEEEEAARTRQAAACSSDLARVRKEHDQCEQQAQAEKAEITRLTGEVTDARNEIVRNIENIPIERPQAAPRPGSEVLGGFPSGAGSAGLVFLGIVVLTAGFFLGWPGRSRRARRVSGGVSVMVALFVYLVSVALLPDTQFGELLLAATAAVLVVAFRALARSQWELRLRGPPPPSP